MLFLDANYNAHEAEMQFGEVFLAEIALDELNASTNLLSSEKGFKLFGAAKASISIIFFLFVCCGQGSKMPRV